jgi:hypothetical protein
MVMRAKCRPRTRSVLLRVCLTACRAGRPPVLTLFEHREAAAKGAQIVLNRVLQLQYTQAVRAGSTIVCVVLPSGAGPGSRTASCPASQPSSHSGNQPASHPASQPANQAANQPRLAGLANTGTNQSLQTGGQWAPTLTTPFSAPRSSRSTTVFGGGCGGQELSVTMNLSHSRPALSAAAFSSGMYCSGRLAALQQGRYAGCSRPN